jgi:cholesterol oxidase
VFAAGALGTVRLLLGLRAGGRLPNLSPRVGAFVRSNSETFRGATARRPEVDYSAGVAITSAFDPDAETQIEAVRYPRGSNLMGLLGTILVERGRAPRIVRFAGKALRHPVLFLRASSVYRWSERTIVLLVMQTRDNSLRLSLRRGLLGARLTSSRPGGERLPSDIEAGDTAARAAAEIIGGFPGSPVNEVLMDIPLTAHVLGGACMGTSAQDGVIDPYHRVFGHPGLHVVDGAAISANLGANPALTITAMAERAMAYWPNRGDPDPRPPMGDPRPVDPVPPRSPIAPAARSMSRGVFRGRP